MKPLFSLWLLLAGLAQGLAANAQDVIFKTSGEEIAAKVLEITPTKVMFTQPSLYQDSLLSLPRQEVFMVKYANGEKELLQVSVEPVVAITSEGLTDSQLFQQGQQDAKRYYSGTNALWGSAGLTLLLGLPGTVIIAAVPPKINPREVPDVRLLSNHFYTRGYISQAHRRKVGKAAIGAGVAIGALVAIIASAASSQ